MTALTQQKNKQQNRRGLLALLTVVVALILAVAIAGCQADTPAADTEPETPQELWAAQNIDSYRFDLQIGCFCLYEMVRPVTIEVVDGEVKTITYIDDGAAADPLFFDGFATIDQLFERLAEREAENPVKFDVVYDETYGIPLSADIDVSELMADEELMLTISNFEALR